MWGKKQHVEACASEDGSGEMDAMHARCRSVLGRTRKVAASICIA